jgi:hypothetical protein
MLDVFEYMPVAQTKTIQYEQTSKIRVLLLYLAYPFALASYFREALENRPDVDLKITGVYTGAWIPWMGGMELSKKYVKPIDIPLPFNPSIGEVNYDLVKAQLGDWKPDIIINVDAGLHWKYKPSDGYVVTVATDPHVLNYDVPRKYSDKFFNMQKVYSQRGDIYLPYAYSQYDHFAMDRAYKYINGEQYLSRDIDAVLGGMPYENRVNWVMNLRNRGISVLFENGPVFDEYRELNNRAHIGLNWSSMDDLNARVFELPAMGLAPVMNYVSDIHEFMAPNSHYLEFTNMNEAIEQVMWLKSHPVECQELADRAYRNIQGQTYDARIEQIFTECGF